MKRNLMVALAAIAACSFAWAQATDRNVRSAGSAEDEAAIRGIVQARMAGNNLLEEFQNYANVAPDLDWENAFGGHVSGRDEVHKFMAERVRSSVTEASEAILDTRVLFVSPDVAIADVYWREEGQKNLALGQVLPDRRGRTTFFLVKKEGSWWDVVERVTDLRAARSPVIDQIAAMEKELAGAETTGDVAVLDRDTAEDCTVINPQGYRTTKQALLKAMRDGSYKVESKDVKILEVRSYGEAAVVVGVSTMKGKWKDADISGTGLFTRVWVRRSNRWQAQTIQQTHAAENWDETAIRAK